MKKADIEKNPYVTDRSWIGQGYGYKADWDSAELDDVIYIPEYGYTTEDEVRYMRRVLTDCNYTLASHSGDHEKWKKRNCPNVVIPIKNKEINRMLGRRLYIQIMENENRLSSVVNL